MIRSSNRTELVGFGIGVKEVPEIYTQTHTHTLPQAFHFLESSFRGMVIHARDGKTHALQMECAPRKGAMKSEPQSCRFHGPV